jgi:hypothetical protein
METTTVFSLSVNDTILDNEGIEMRVTAKETKGRMVTLTVEYVEAGMMVCRPQPTTFRLSGNKMVRVPVA